jgi:ubiquitin-like 1-activating enzyme E1 A
MADLTDEQAAVYDRQIRIWGADVQKRLTSAKVLLLGCTPIAAEVAKNFILAGVGSLTLVDDTPADRVPTSFLSMYGSSAMGGAVAALFAAGLQEMNPMVTVSSIEGNAAEVPDDSILRQFGLVLCFGQHCGIMASVNDACRRCGVKFIGAVSRGALVWAFADLLSHTCSLKIEQNSSENDRRVVLAYSNFRDTVARSWSVFADKRQVNGFLAPWTVIAQLEIDEARRLTMADLSRVEELGKARLAEDGCKAEFWDSNAVTNFLCGEGEFAPANAVAGGFIANDVVRCVSQAGLPTYNVLLFSIINNVAQVHNLSGGAEAEQ